MSSTVETLCVLDNKLGESPIWHAARQKIYWLDLYAPALFECNADGSHFRARPIAAEAPIGSLVASTEPHMVVIALKTGLHLLNLDTLELTFYCDPENGRAGVIPNDLKVDRWGRIWLATSHEREKDPRGALWCVSGKNNWALADVGFPVSNGPAFSRDGHTMYFNDSVGRQTLAYDISNQHLRAEHRRVLATYSETEGVPDGLTVDENGDLWIAMWAGACVLQLSGTGEKLKHINVPAFQPSSVAFAGAAMNWLAITSARDGLPDGRLTDYPLSGSLFACDLDVKGIPEPLFKLGR